MYKHVWELSVKESLTSKTKKKSCSYNRKAFILFILSRGMFDTYYSHSHKRRVCALHGNIYDMILLTLTTVNLNKFLLTQESEVSQNPLYLHWSLAKQFKTLPPLKGKTWSHTFQKNFVPKQSSLLLSHPSCVIAIECYYFTVMSLNFTGVTCSSIPLM